MGRNFFIIFVSFFVACDTSSREYKEFYDTGELQIKGKFENNKREGEWVVYDKLGGISQKLFYRNDSLYKRETYTNETLTIEETLLDSVRHGELKIFFENGNVQAITNFVNGEEQGMSKEFYPNGSLRVSFIRVGDKIKNFRQYFANGELFVEAENLDNGINHYSDSLGNRTFDVLYKNGEIVDTLKSYQ